MTTSRAPRSGAVRVVLASLGAACVAEPASEARRSFGWALALWGAGVDDIPLVVVHDLGFLLLRGRALRLRSGRVGVVGGDDVAFDGDVDDDVAAIVRRARLDFEERVMAPCSRDPSVHTASVLMAGAPPSLQDRLVAHALAELWPRVRGTRSWPRQSVSALRAVADSFADVHDAGDDTDAVIFDVDAFEGAALDLDDVAPAGVASPLLRPDEVWELSRLEALPSEAMRLALRTMHRTMNAIGPMAPGVMSALRDRRANVVIDDDHDADAFPAGGFDAMSTKGALENLVRSEVAYVGVGNEHDARAADLFDVRYVEGELLYYTRDESPLLERRRVMNVAILEVERARHKLAELPTQTIVLIEAVVLAAFLDLQQTFGPPLVQLQLAVDGDAAVVDEEVGLITASLDSEIVHRRAVLMPLGLLPVERRVVFSPRPPPEGASKSTTLLWVRVGELSWTVSEHPHGPEQRTGVDPRTGLRALVDRIAAFA